MSRSARSLLLGAAFGARVLLAAGPVGAADYLLLIGPGGAADGPLIEDVFAARLGEIDPNARLAGPGEFVQPVPAPAEALPEAGRPTIARLQRLLEQGRHRECARAAADTARSVRDEGLLLPPGVFRSIVETGLEAAVYAGDRTVADILADLIFAAMPDYVPPGDRFPPSAASRISARRPAGPTVVVETDPSDVTIVRDGHPAGTGRSRMIPDDKVRLALVSADGVRAVELSGLRPRGPVVQLPAGCLLGARIESGRLLAGCADHELRALSAAIVPRIVFADRRQGRWELALYADGRPLAQHRSNPDERLEQAAGFMFGAWLGQAVAPPRSDRGKDWIIPVVIGSVIVLAAGGVGIWLAVRDGGGGSHVTVIP